VRQTTAALAPWLLPTGAAILDTAGHPPHTAVQILLAAAATCTTILIAGRAGLHTLIHHIRAADNAISHGYEMAAEHCAEIHQLAIPHLRRAACDTTTVVQQAVAVGTVYTSAAYPHIHEQRRKPNPGPRHLASVPDD
jgi:hypothetical protein